MRIMPFMKRKNGVQFAGVGLDIGSGGGGGGGGSSPDYVIGEEVDTGLKFKGKHLYRKTFELDGETSWSTRAAIDNVDSAFIDNSMSHLVVGIGILPINYYFDNNNRTAVFLRRSGNKVHPDYNIATTFDGTHYWTITILYTKTTE